MDSIIRCFTWCLGDVNLWLSSNRYSIESPTFSMGHSLCKFYLRFNYDRQANEFQVLVCRRSDGGPSLVETKHFLVLKTANGYILDSTEFTVSLPMEGSEPFPINVTKENLLRHVVQEREKDVIIVTCESTLLESSLLFLNDDVRDLALDLSRLREEECSANAYFVVEGQRIPVHKEILSSRSPVMKRNFNKCDNLFDNRFPAAVVKTMLDYLYSSAISLKELDIEQLHTCATYYEIPDLIKLLTPRKTYVTTLANSKTETHTLKFSDFTALCKSRHSVEHHRIKMKFNEDIEMSVKILFEPYRKHGKIILETTLLNLVNVRSVFIRLFILDHSSTPIIVDEMPLSLRSERKLFYLEYESQKLFTGRHSILPNDVFTLRYELKFQLSGGFHISDPDVSDGSDGREWNNETSIALIKGMTSVLESKHCADAFLVLPSTEKKGDKQIISVRSPIFVHKSILSLRSPVFRELFVASKQILVDLNESALKVLLHYVYTGVLLPVHHRTLVKLHAAAITYRINPLKRACEEAAAKLPLGTRNVYSFYLIAIRGGEYKLQKSCESFVMENKDLIFGSHRLRRLKEINEPAWKGIERCISLRS